MDGPGTLQVLRESALKGVRKVIAARLGAIWRQAVHVTLHRKLDVTGYYRNKPQLAHSLTDYLLFTLVRTLSDERYAAFNAHFVEPALRCYRSVNLGLAVDHPKGLIVPVLHGAETMDLDGFAVRRKQLMSAAKEWRHKPEDLENGTFTVSNLGTMGIDFFTPILNPPQTAILGLGRVTLETVAWRWEDRPEPRALLPVSLTIDHRVLDGADAARFLQSLEDEFAAQIARAAGGACGNAPG